MPTNKLITIISLFLISAFLYSCSSDVDMDGKKSVNKYVEKPSSDNRGTDSEGSTAFKPIGKEITKDVTDIVAEPQTRNHPPKIKGANLIVAAASNRDYLKVEASATDPDGDDVILEYEWFKNGKPAGSGDTFDDFKRGDKISVKVRPYDGEEYGIVKIFKTEIKNTTPRIMENKDFKFDGDVYTQQINAFDPDGDPLTFKLTKAPEGMKIDEKSGLITWAVGPDITGTFPVQVSVTDGHGGKSTYDFKVTIKVEAAK